MNQIDYLDSERKKLWEKILTLEEAINAIRPETEQEARGASNKVAEYRNRARISHEEITQLQNEVRQRAVDSKTQYDACITLLEEAKPIVTVARQNAEAIAHLKADTDLLVERIANFSASADDAEANLEEKEAALAEVESLQGRILENSQKADLLLKNCTAVSEKINGIETEIFGFTKTDDAGQDKVVPGLKDKLEKSYTDLEKKLAASSGEIAGITGRAKEQSEEVFESWTKRHETLNTKIESLLPKALTKGLSEAYSVKKEEEKSEGNKINRTFYAAIIIMVLISAIPFVVSLKSMDEGLSLNDALLRVPRLVLAIVPLYIPILWVAYSANRKANLSKRLVEEYSHKEVLAKTYEGLSKQINDISDSSSPELRIKLLYNILEISAENPGKLISDYNKSDHPLMDALDKSIKLTNAVEKLSRIPGFTKVATQMKERADKILETEQNKATAGLASLDSGTAKN